MIHCKLKIVYHIKCLYKINLQIETKLFMFSVFPVPFSVDVLLCYCAFVHFHLCRLSFPVMVQRCGQWIISIWWSHCFCLQFLAAVMGAPFYTRSPSGWEKIEFYFNLLLTFHWFLQCWFVKPLYTKTWKYNTEEVLESMVRVEFLFLFSKDGGYQTSAKGKWKSSLIHCRKE